MAPFHLKDTSFLGDATDYEKEILTPCASSRMTAPC